MDSNTLNGQMVWPVWGNIAPNFSESCHCSLRSEEQIPASDAGQTEEAVIPNEKKRLSKNVQKYKGEKAKLGQETFLERSSEHHNS